MDCNFIPIYLVQGYPWIHFIKFSLWMINLMDLEIFWEPLWNIMFGFNYKRMMENSIAIDAWHLLSFVLADDPTNNANIEGDPYKTLFVARIVSAWIYLFITFVMFVLSIILSLTKWIVLAPHMGHKTCEWCWVLLFFMLNYETTEHKIQMELECSSWRGSVGSGV